MTKTFDLKNVTIVIDQKPTDQKYGWYHLAATNPNSPIRICDTPKQIGEYFGNWLSNTIERMEENHCKTIKMELTWE